MIIISIMVELLMTRHKRQAEEMLALDSAGISPADARLEMSSSVRDFSELSQLVLIRSAYAASACSSALPSPAPGLKPAMHR